jgi:hypothetical protein
MQWKRNKGRPTGSHLDQLILSSSALFGRRPNEDDLSRDVVSLHGFDRGEEGAETGDGDEVVTFADESRKACPQLEQFFLTRARMKRAL